MISTDKILQSALFISAFFLSIYCIGQKDNKLKLIPGSEILEFDNKTGITKLIGNVHFTYQSNEMFCDSAFYDTKRNTVRAYGHVHLNKRDTLNLFCDSLYYNDKTRKAKLWGNVRVRDQEYKLTTDTLEYDAKASQAHYHYGGTVSNSTSNEVLSSRVGYFHPESKNFFFSHNVKYRSPDLQMTTDTLKFHYYSNKTYFFGPTNIENGSAKLYCERGWYDVESGAGEIIQNAWIERGSDYISGDTLIYAPLEGYNIGKGHVYYRDSTENISFYGDFAFNSDSLNYSYLTGHALAEKVNKDDTLYIHADTLYTNGDSTRSVKAWNHAMIYSSSFQGKADSISYNEESGELEMFRNPIVWSKESELKGDFISIIVKDSSIHRINISEHSTVIMEVEKGQFYNQIGGKFMVAHFKKDELDFIDVKGNATTVFFPIEEKMTDSAIVRTRIGMNRLYAADLKVYVDSQEVTGVTYIDQPDGVFYPMEKLNKEEQFIQHFSWNPQDRPLSKDDMIHDEINTGLKPETEN